MIESHERELELGPTGPAESSSLCGSLPTLLAGKSARDTRCLWALLESRSHHRAHSLGHAWISRVEWSLVSYQVLSDDAVGLLRLAVRQIAQHEWVSAESEDAFDRGP